MTRANVARHGGDEWQARWFWFKAAKLLDPKSAISRVAWEEGPKGLDDIVIDYDPPRQLTSGRFGRDYVQCKWHVRPGVYGFGDLTDPGFINASSTSWLQRAYAAFTEAPDQPARFELKTNWYVDGHDALAGLIRQEHGGLDIDKLYAGKTTRSASGAVRAYWCDHLGISDDALRLFASRLAFSNIDKTLDDLQDDVNDRLAYAGLKPEPDFRSSFRYDELIIKLHQQGPVSWDEAALRDLCDRENLWAESRPPERPYTIGIRSFMHRYDALDDRCDDLLDLVPHFDDRFLRPGRHWDGDIDAEVSGFLAKRLVDHDSVCLVVDAHASIAVATGRMLDVKSGRALIVDQRVPGAGHQDWGATTGPADNPLVIHSEITDANELVVALGVTHDVRRGVDVYCADALPDVSRLDAMPDGGPGIRSVAGGAHAWALAEQLAQAIRAIPGVPGRHIHLFAAAPNALLVFFGQHLGLSPLTVYEWDLQGERGGGYQPGITFKK